MKNTLRSFARHHLNSLLSGKRGNMFAVLVLVCAGLFGLDFITGPAIQEPYVYVLLVILTVWFLRPGIGYVLALVLPLSRVIAHFFWATPLPMWETIVNVAIQTATLGIVAFFLTAAKELVHEVSVLKGKLPICVHCTRIRNLEGTWERLEEYITRQSEVKFSRGVCSECSEKYAGDNGRKSAARATAGAGVERA